MQRLSYQSNSREVRLLLALSLASMIMMMIRATAEAKQPIKSMIGAFFSLWKQQPRPRIPTIATTKKSITHILMPLQSHRILKNSNQLMRAQRMAHAATAPMKNLCPNTGTSPSFDLVFMQSHTSSPARQVIEIAATRSLPFVLRSSTKKQRARSTHVPAQKYQSSSYFQPSDRMASSPVSPIDTMARMQMTWFCFMAGRGHTCHRLWLLTQLFRQKKATMMSTMRGAAQSTQWTVLLSVASCMGRRDKQCPVCIRQISCIGGASYKVIQQQRQQTPVDLMEQILVLNQVIFQQKMAPLDLASMMSRIQRAMETPIQAMRSPIAIFLLSWSQQKTAARATRAIIKKRMVHSLRSPQSRAILRNSSQLMTAQMMDQATIAPITCLWTTVSTSSDLLAVCLEIHAEMKAMPSMQAAARTSLILVVSSWRKRQSMNNPQRPRYQYQTLSLFQPDVRMASSPATPTQAMAMQQMILFCFMEGLNSMSQVLWLSTQALRQKQATTKRPTTGPMKSPQWMAFQSTASCMGRRERWWSQCMLEYNLTSGDKVPQQSNKIRRVYTDVLLQLSKNWNRCLPYVRLSSQVDDKYFTYHGQEDCDIFITQCLRRKRRRKSWPFWNPQCGGIEKVDGWLTNFANQLKALVNQEQSVQQNYEVLCEKIGFNVHPCLIRKEAGQYPNLKNTDYGERYVSILNAKVDIVTLKLLGFLIGQLKLNSLKLSNNALTEAEADQIKKILQKDDSLTALYFEWNPLTDHPRRQQIFMTCLRPTLQHLILRECKLGNELSLHLIKKIRETPDNQLKSIDLYGNQLTPELSEDIIALVEESKVIEFLGLSKNELAGEDFVNKLFGSIGDVAISEEELEQHRAKEKARDEVLQRNKKRKKGAPQQPVPFLFELKQVNGAHFFVKNQSIKTLNLASNGIRDVCAPHIRKFAEGSGKGVQLFIEGNRFTKNTKETLKFYDNVIL